MNEQKKSIIKYVSEWTLAAMTVIVGVLFIWQTLTIYISGHAPDYDGEYVYSSERVVEALSRVAPYFWIWVALCVIVYVISQIIPSKTKIKPDIRYTLRRMKKKLGTKADYIGNDSYAYIKREELIINILWLICGVFCLIGAIYGIVYLADTTHFPKSNVNGEVFNMVVNIFPFVIAAFVFACGISIYEGKSAKNQIKIVRELTKGRKATERASKLSILSDKRVVLGVRVAVTCVAVAFVIAGVFNDGMRDVLIKAVNICTECIGLG